MRRRNFVALGVSFTGAALAGAGTANAQDFPNKPITILVGYAAGGNIDVTARTVGQALSTVLGQPVVIDNRPGAAGLIAQTAVAKAKPDGYTLVLSGTTGFVLAPRLVPTPPYTLDDFVGIGSTSETPLVLEVPANSRFKTFAEFAAYAKANPEAIASAIPATARPTMSRSCVCSRCWARSSRRFPTRARRRPSPIFSAATSTPSSTRSRARSASSAPAPSSRWR
ncbi:hypothetical protein OSTOST_13966 [Ostertagia ostertagi]